MPAAGGRLTIYAPASPRLTDVHLRDAMPETSPARPRRIADIGYTARRTGGIRQSHCRRKRRRRSQKPDSRLRACMCRPSNDCARNPERSRRGGTLQQSFHHLSGLSPGPPQTGAPVRGRGRRTQSHRRTGRRAGRRLPFTITAWSLRRLTTDYASTGCCGRPSRVTWRWSSMFIGAIFAGADTVRWLRENGASVHPDPSQGQEGTRAPAVGSIFPPS